MLEYMPPGISAFLTSSFGAGNPKWASILWQDRTVEFGVDLLRKFVGERVERLRHRLLFAEDRNFELFADLLELGVDFGNGLHIDSRIDPQFLAEDVDQLDSRRSRTAAEVPAVGIDDIDSCDDRRQHRCQTVARGAVGVEIDGDIQILLEELHQFAHAGSDPTYP